MKKMFFMFLFGIFVTVFNLEAQNYPTKYYFLSLDAQNSGAAPEPTNNPNCSGGCYVVIRVEVPTEPGASPGVRLFEYYYRESEAKCKYGWAKSKTLYNPVSGQLEKFVRCRTSVEQEEQFRGRDD